MFKLPGIAAGSDIETLFRTVGFIVVQWGHAEQSLEMIVSTLYDWYPGEKPKKLPFMLEKKLDFIRNSATSTTEPLIFAPDLIKLADDFESLADVRHNLIHGAITSFEPEGDTFTFIKLRSSNDVGNLNAFPLSSADFPSLTKRLLCLGKEATHLARKLWNAKPNGQ
jgi:hypothetical protein